VNPEDDAKLSTENLLAAAQKGDEQAVQSLLHRHLPQLRAFIRLRCGAELRAKESASDLVQSVCRDVIQNMGGFQWEGEAAFRAWLCTAAARKVADRAAYWNTARRDVAKEATGGDEALLMVYRQSASPSEVVQGREALERIEGAFDKLPEDYREAIVLSRILGLPREEVAKRMGKTEDSVRHLLFRGLAQLARLVEEKKSGG
jgi:RNA polymerase sigma-70 factor (ECF subfamily)